MNTKELEDRYEVPVYPRRDIVLVRGKGARLYDDRGREYIDCASNVGVSNIGHGHEEVAKAIHDGVPVKREDNVAATREAYEAVVVSTEPAT